MVKANFEQRISAWLDGRISNAESETLQNELRADVQARTTFRQYTELDSVTREAAESESVEELLSAGGSTASLVRSEAPSYTKTTMGVTAAIIVVLITALWVQLANRTDKIVRVTGLSGALIWIGNGGKLVQASDASEIPTTWANVLSKDGELPGGTIEGMASDSWFKLEFHDGSSAMIFGHSTLTFSDQGKKVLRLKTGQFSASVMPQSAPDPLVIHTHMAELTVVKAQLEVEAGPTSTMLYVRDGTVEIRRQSDDKTVSLAAGQRLVVSIDGDMYPSLISAERSWSETKFWENIASIDDNPNWVATQGTHDFDGSHTLIFSEGPARIPAQDTLHTIRSDDTFKVEYVWLGGKWWAGDDQVAVKLYTTDNDLIDGSPHVFATMLSGPTIINGTYQAASGQGAATDMESGKRLFVMIDTENGGGKLDGIAHLDNFHLQVIHSEESAWLPLTDFSLQKATVPPEPESPGATMLIGGRIRNGDFNNTASE